MITIGQFPFLYVLIICCLLIYFVSNGIDVAPSLIYTYCPNATCLPTANPELRSSLNTLLDNLSAATNRSSSTPGFYNSTAGTFYGLYLCRGDIGDPATCRECVATAMAQLTQKCPLGKQAVTWYDLCMVRYSDVSFFGEKDNSFGWMTWSTQNITNNVTGFNQVLNTTLHKVASGAARGGAMLKFDTEEAKFNDFQTVYALGQCTPDLSERNCLDCLLQSIIYIPTHGNQGGQILYFGCNLRYEIYRFYEQVSKLTPISTYCPKTILTNSPAIEFLLHNLSFLANTSSSPGFHNYTVGVNTRMPLYGLYLCRGDVLVATCRDCVAAASAYLSQNCKRGKQATVLYEVCMIRYSTQSFFGKLYPNLLLNTSMDTNLTKDGPEFNSNLGFNLNFGFALRGIMDRVNNKTEKKNFFTDTENITDTDHSIYALGQCIPDLSSDDCHQCLENCTKILQTCCKLKQGASVYFFGCSLRFELNQFYNLYSDNDKRLTSINSSSEGAIPPASSSHNLKKGDTSRGHIPLIITGSVIIAVCFTLLFWGLKKIEVRATSTVDLSDIVNTESLQMDFSTIRAATQNFAIDRKLGQGGFGPVYKGTLENGQEVAVKRLSHNSGQGVVEFKTEVLLVAKLQHRNLVKLLGFCVSGKEKLLVYEFLSNSSLDKILFDPTKRMSLNWERRFKIICGIAKGLMYLHEDSRLRVVHRDLKSSNILLDEAMNPKISDFGLAKLFGVDQTQAVTDSITGTYGYMAPEYILMGHYSIKSDVYSFGIIVLEVLSGHRNKYINRPSLEEPLLYRAWKIWNEGEALKLMDETLGGNYSREDAIKCIHISLLCIQESAAKRPNMTSIVAALGGQSITLPPPSPPNFFNNSSTTSATNTSTSEISSAQGVSIGQTSDITQLYGR